MIFRIVDANKQLDLYNVLSNSGEQMNVSSLQIVRVMAKGYKFDNAYLTKRGFALETDRGTRYFQISMDHETQILVNNALQKIKETKVNKQETQKKISGNRTSKIPVHKNTKIVYRGDTYLSDMSLCRKFNADVERFRILRSKGYSVDESLGLKPLRSAEELISNKQIQRTLDSMARVRGEF